MAQYILKSTLVVEIERWLREIDRGFPNDHNLGRCDAYKRMLSLINTLEVKEVDLDKEFDKCCENYVFDDECEVYTAKRFFKLGFKVAQNGE